MFTFIALNGTSFTYPGTEIRVVYNQGSLPQYHRPFIDVEEDLRYNGTGALELCGDIPETLPDPEPDDFDPDEEALYYSDSDIRDYYPDLSAAPGSSRYGAVSPRKISFTSDWYRNAVKTTVLPAD